MAKYSLSNSEERVLFRSFIIKLVTTEFFVESPKIGALIGNNLFNPEAVRGTAKIEKDGSINSKPLKLVITSSSTIQETKSAFLVFLMLTGS